MQAEVLLLALALVLVGMNLLCHGALARRLEINSLAAASMMALLLLYLPCLLAGIGGVYTAPVVYGLSLVLSLLSLGWCRLESSKQAPVARSSTALPLTGESGWLLLVGLVLMSPLFTLIYELPQEILKKDIWLPWDAVSYHLPALVEYIQAKSFWSHNGPYQSYSFAYEATVNFLSLVFPSHLGFVLGNTLSALLFCFAVVYLLEVIDRQTEGLVRIHPLALSALIIGVWCLLFKNKLIAIGKNDIFQAACILMALAALLDLLGSRPEQQARKRYLLLLALGSAGLALGTKPTALAYVPFFLVLVQSSRWVRGTAMRANLASLPAWRFSLGFGLGVYLVGGFFLTRNYLLYGTINPLPSAFQLSLFANLGNPALYEFKLGGLVFLCSLLSLFLWLIPFSLAPTRQGKRLFCWLLLFHLWALAAFVITPHAIFHHTTQWTTWKLRLGLPLFTCMVVVSVYVVCLAGARVRQWGPVGARLLVVACSLLLVVVAALPAVRSLPGLPHYEQIKGHPPTKAYQWIQQQEGAQRIYAAGLRPYGLVGTAWQNQLFYDLHSAGLDPLRKGVVRIKSILQVFHPDLIAISVDPHPYTGKRMPAVTRWMQRHPDCFHLEFSDGAVMIFRVAHDALHRLDPSGTFKARPVRMRG